MSDDPYRDLKDFEARNDQAQSGLRRIASVWLLATIGAAGFVVIEPALCQPQGIPRIFVFMAVLNLGMAGLLLLWSLDRGVYQSLLHSAFVLGMLYEKKKPILPIRTFMWVAHGSISLRIALFYWLPIGFFWIVTLGAMFRAMPSFCPASNPGLGLTTSQFWAGWAFVLIELFAFLLLVYARKCRPRDLETKAALLGDCEFTKLIKNGPDKTGAKRHLEDRLRVALPPNETADEADADGA